MAIDDATNEVSFHKDLDAGLNRAMSSSKLSSNHARSRKILSVSSQKSFHKPQFSATPTHRNIDKESHRNIDREHSDFDQLSKKHSLDSIQIGYYEVRNTRRISDGDIIRE